MDALEPRINHGIDVQPHPAVAAFAEKLAAEAGADAALFYGSNRRTGELDGVLDFYLLKRTGPDDRIWPRVSYHEWEYDGVPLRAKVAAMQLDVFTKAAAGETRDTTIWARFVQPCSLVWHRDDQARSQVVQALRAAAVTASRFAAALGPELGVEDDFWRALFRETYKAEFRVEKAGREDSILALNRAHFSGLLVAALQASGIKHQAAAEGSIRIEEGADWKAAVQRKWRRQRRWGKPLNIVRLFKASTTFEGAGRYAAWKVERHTGVPVKLTPWREKHPILAAPGVLFRVWRARRKG
ncbi:hypothetical protein [Pontixanthobacter luteolus]|uniref:hypothetical protein n=1 Tax=Pontixanthobacter luteolus TaxID=295089 RepID=UPI0023026E37|nr:hypothetical protein [Pontixanthobacter luteolus]